MKNLRNPFTTLYVTERMDESKFPSLFSTTMVPLVTPLFEEGNVVVKGTQGSGKSMLLALLKTSVRVAYAKSETHDYPVEDGELNQFIAAGINLATNQALRTVDRWKKGSDDNSLLTYSFVDYVNSWILRDLLESLDLLTSSPDLLWKPAKLGGKKTDLEDAVASFNSFKIVSAYLHGEPTVKTVLSSLTKRIDTYLGFFNGRPKELPAEIYDSQTLTLGQPIADAVTLLQDRGAISKKTRVLISIDQFEQLLELEESLPDRPYKFIRETIDLAMHRREPTISFRVGTRPYAWDDSSSESLRDYHRINLDEMLQKTEHGNRMIFKTLANDAFKRRLKLFGYDFLCQSDDPISDVMGPYSLPRKRVEKIGRKTDWSKQIKTPKDLTEHQEQEVRRIAEVAPLDAKLAVAWFLQKQEEIEGASFGGEVSDLPWNLNEKKWWKKERNWIAMLQLAADSRQRIVLHGKKDIVDLASANILVFTSICQFIWNCWIKDLVSKNKDPASETPINWTLQNDGINQASREWRNKVRDEGLLGTDLAAFIDQMANWLREGMLNDVKMSYPGGNGISLADQDLKSNPKAEAMLEEGCGRGFLIQRKHTSKSASRGESTKWYPHPILAPYYRLTITQTKEPRYLKAYQLNDWLKKAGIIAPDHQMRLPGISDSTKSDGND